MTTVEVQFATQHDLVSWAIRFFTWSNVSHVDLVMPDGTLLGARAKGGVERRLPGYAPFSKIERYSINLPDMDAQKLFKAAESQIGKPYDFEAIVGIFFRRDWRETDSWFCSELIAWAFEEAGHPLLNSAYVNRVTPRDLTISTLLQKDS